MKKRSARWSQGDVSLKSIYAWYTFLSSLPWNIFSKFTPDICKMKFPFGGQKAYFQGRNLLLVSESVTIYVHVFVSFLKVPTFFGWKEFLLLYEEKLELPQSLVLYQIREVWAWGAVRQKNRHPGKNFNRKEEGYLLDLLPHLNRCPFGRKILFTIKIALFLGWLFLGGFGISRIH